MYGLLLVVDVVFEALILFSSHRFSCASTVLTVLKFLFPPQKIKKYSIDMANICCVLLCHSFPLSFSFSFFFCLSSIYSMFKSMWISAFDGDGEDGMFMRGLVFLVMALSIHNTKLKNDKMEIYIYIATTIQYQHRWKNNKKYTYRN